MLKEFAARHPRSLHEKVHSVLYKKFLHRAGDLLHVAVICEKDKRAPIGLFDEMRDPSLQLFLISGVARVGHFSHDKHFHLPLKIERTAELQRFRFCRAGALTKISEIRLAYCESGAGHDATAVLAKEHPPQHGRKIDGRGVEGEKPFGFPCALDPVNVFWRALLQKSGHAIPSIANAPTEFL